MSLFTIYKRQIETLLKLVEENEFVLPQFQRKFVWSMDKVADLIDSILKGYPVGAIMLWNTAEKELTKIRSIITGEIISESEEKPMGGYNYVLDGQQRITTLNACVRGAEIGKGEFEKVYVNLSASNRDEKIVFLEKEKNKKIEDERKLSEKDFISVKELWSSGKKTGKEKEYRDMLRGHFLPIIQLNNVSIDVAVDIFERINVKGQSLKIFEVMVARTYDQKFNKGEGFDLSERYAAFYEKLKNAQYHTIDSEIVLRVAAALLTGKYGKKDILSLNKKEFREGWNDICNAILSTIDRLRSTYGVGCSRLLPHPAIIVPIAYFFHKVKKGTGGILTSDQEAFLDTFFWRTLLSARYSVNTDSRVPRDIKEIMDAYIEDGTMPTYDDYSWFVDSLPEYIKNRGSFNRNDPYIKALLCVYASKEPADFHNGKAVAIKDENLKKSNCPNYHHFFPSNFMEERGQGEHPFVNHILNITFISGDLNKAIRDRAPSDYMDEYKDRLVKNHNEKIGEVMKKHLIGDGTDNSLRDFGIWQDDFDTFIEKRAELLGKEIEDLIK